MMSVDGFAGVLDETPFLLIGVVLLATLLVVQVLWAYRNATGSGAGPVATPEADSASELDDGMMVCPECGRPTEVEYRLCRHCVEDTGRSYAGSGGDGGSRSSGML
jgi:hypothetical protein